MSGLRRISNEDLLDVLIPVVTAWEEATDVVIGGGFGAVTAFKVMKRRVGQNLEMEAYWTNGSVSASIGTVTLPVGLILDTTVLTRNNTTSNPGHYCGDFGGDGSGNHGRMVTATATSLTTIYTGSAYSQATGITPNAANAAAITSGRSVLRISVPIAGWTATQTLRQQLGL